MTKIIGLTGGIGSGKTYVASLFNQKGIPVYNSDNEAKKIMTDSAVIEQLKINFGEAIIQNNTIDRKKLAALVFNNPTQLQQLNSIIHPLVKIHFENWVKQQNTAFVLKESAILFESGANQNCDIVITVEAPIAVRIERVIKRDNSTLAQVQDRIKNQLTENERVKKSNFVVHNTNKTETEEQVDAIFKHIMQHDVNV